MINQPVRPESRHTRRGWREGMLTWLTVEEEEEEAPPFSVGNAEDVEAPP